VKASALALTPLRGRLNEAAFFFARQLVGGQIKNLESYKTEKQNYSPTVKPGDFIIDGKILDAFRAFVVKDKQNGLTAENINSQLDYAKSRLRDELATANHSTEAGQQVLLETDPQVLKAIDAIPEARKLLGTITVNK
jgi:hypothetical protein